MSSDESDDRDVFISVLKKCITKLIMLEKQLEMGNQKNSAKPLSWGAMHVRGARAETCEK